MGIQWILAFQQKGDWLKFLTNHDYDIDIDILPSIPTTSLLEIGLCFNLKDTHIFLCQIRMSIRFVFLVLSINFTS